MLVRIMTTASVLLVAGCTASTSGERPDYTQSKAALAAAAAPKCEIAGDCASGLCLNTVMGKVCTKACKADADCGMDWHCATWTGLTTEERYCAPGHRVNWTGAVP